MLKQKQGVFCIKYSNLGTQIAFKVENGTVFYGLIAAAARSYIK